MGGRPYQARSSATGSCWTGLPLDWALEEDAGVGEWREILPSDGAMAGGLSSGLETVSVVDVAGQGGGPPLSGGAIDDTPFKSKYSPTTTAMGPTKWCEGPSS